MTEAAMLDRIVDERCGMEIFPINGTFGARIEGVSLAADNPKEVTDAVLAALDKYRVLVFRNQHDLTERPYMRFATAFGEPETVPHPSFEDFEDAEGKVPGIRLVNTDAANERKNFESWHTDGAPRANRHWISLLRAVIIPPYGRDTAYADMVSLYERLSPAMQKFLEGLSCKHSWGMQKPDAAPVDHPMVITNPRTGVKSLYVNQLYTRSVNELRHDEGAALLNFLFQAAKMPEIQLRHTWQKGDVVMWDNEYTQHYIVLDQDYPRVMQRIMVTDHT